jgi:hypothetical protein
MTSNVRKSMAAKAHGERTGGKSVALRSHRVFAGSGLSVSAPNARPLVDWLNETLHRRLSS